MNEAVVVESRGTYGVGDSPQPQKAPPNPQPPQCFLACGGARVRVAAPAEGGHQMLRGAPYICEIKLISDDDHRHSALSSPNGKLRLKERIVFDIRFAKASRRC